MALEYKPLDKRTAIHRHVSHPPDISAHEDGMIFESVKTVPGDASGPVMPDSRRKEPQLYREENYVCGFCKSAGEKPRGSVCSSCHGKKQVQLSPPVVMCAACRGRGESPPRSNINCTTCRGTGWVAVTEPVEKCKSCRGRGRTTGSNLPCVSCKGVGVRTVRQ